jgi:ribosomal peptide maturation radical SAM protein 1
MNFRSKSPARVLSGIDHLAGRYNTYAFLSVDNILDQRYIKEVFVPLAEQRKDYTFFFEVKANLTPDQLRILAQGGVRIIQPGIESLSTRVLHLMRKGTTCLHNIRFLKWGRYHDLVVTWNLLFGFPGETVKDYERQAEIMGLIPHLCPPGYVGRIRLDRFSPNFYDREKFGFHAVRPIPAYADVYPKHLNHDSIAYFFTYSVDGQLPDDDYQGVADAVKLWQLAWERPNLPFLVFQRGAGRLTVTDGRWETRPKCYYFGELEAVVYEACTLSAVSAQRLLAFCTEGQSAGASLAAIQQILKQFCDLGLMLEEDGQFLALALPVNPNW